MYYINNIKYLIKYLIKLIKNQKIFKNKYILLLFKNYKIK